MERTGIAVTIRAHSGKKNRRFLPYALLSSKRALVGMCVFSREKLIPCHLRCHLHTLTLIHSCPASWDFRHGLRRCTLQVDKISISVRSMNSIHPTRASTLPLCGLRMEYPCSTARFVLRRTEFFSIVHCRFHVSSPIPVGFVVSHSFRFVRLSRGFLYQSRIQMDAVGYP